MTNPLRGLRIATRLSLIVLVMMVLTLTLSSLITSYFESTLVGEVKDQSESLSKALQISLQQMTSQGMTDDTILKDYVERLSSRGVKEISILSNEKEVLASSNPARLGGKTRRPAEVRGAQRGNGLVITGTLSEEDMGDTEGKTSRELDIPIIVDNEKRGYIRLNLLFDDLAELIRTAHSRRLTAMLAVFLIGTVGVVLLSFRLTRSLSQLASAAARVADGDLSVRVRTDRRDEVGLLIGTFNQMVEKLAAQRALEKRLRRAERASEIGKLASAVAHEIRNPLNLISLSVGHLGSAFRPADPREAEEHGRIITSLRDELKRLNSLVSDFLSYARPPRLALRPCRVEEVLEDVLSLTAARMQEQRIEMARRLETALPEVTADPDGLRTCFLNVVINAVQAMPDGGRLTVAAEVLPGPGESRAVRVDIGDTGCGISPQDIERIFEPYFSTREAGIGLGLAITQRIMQEHGGDIRVTSAPGRGTTFHLEIPVSGPRSAEARREAA